MSFFWFGDLYFIDRFIYVSKVRTGHIRWSPFSSTSSTSSNARSVIGLRAPRPFVITWVLLINDKTGAISAVRLSPFFHLTSWDRAWISHLLPVTSARLKTVFSVRSLLNNWSQCWQWQDLKNSRTKWIMSHSITCFTGIRRLRLKLCIRSDTTE